MKKFVLIGVAAVVVILVVGVLGYLGYVPGVAGLFGWNKPKDLGVVVTAQDYASASEKMGRARLEIPEGMNTDDEIVFEGSHPVDDVFTQEEMTATWQTREYASNPFTSDGQIRINDDNTMEISGALNVPRLLDTIEQYATIDEETMKLIDKAGLIKGDIPFYLNGTVSVTNGDWDIDVKEAKIGPVTIPLDQVPIADVENAARTIVESVPGLSIESFTIVNGKVHFVGTYPDKSYYAPVTE